MGGQGRVQSSRRAVLGSWHFPSKTEDSHTGEGASLSQPWSLPPRLPSSAETEISSPKMQLTLACSISTAVMAFILTALFVSKGRKVPPAFPKTSIGSL